MLRLQCSRKLFSSAHIMLMLLTPSLISKRCAVHQFPQSLTTTPTCLLQPLKTANLAEVVPEWDVNFVNVEKDMLFELILVCASSFSIVAGRGYSFRALSPGCQLPGHQAAARPHLCKGGNYPQRENPRRDQDRV